MLNKILTAILIVLAMTVTIGAQSVNFSIDENNVIFPDGVDMDCVLMVASYTDEKLVDSKIRPLESASTEIQVPIEELGLNVTGADTLKAFLLSDTEKLEPLCVNRRVSLEEKNTRDAYLLAQSIGNFNNPILSIERTPVENIIGGWVLDNRGGVPRTSIKDPIATIQDISYTEGTAFIREFNKIARDVIRADFYASTSGNGFFAEFRDENDNSVYKIEAIDGKWQVLCKNGKYTALSEKVKFNQIVRFRVYIDLVNGVSKTYINDTYFGEHELLSDNVLNFRFASEKESFVSYTPSHMQFTANYAVLEEFQLFHPVKAYGWETAGSCSFTNNVVVMNANSSLSKSFDPIDIKYAAESQIRVNTGQQAAMLVKAGDVVAAEIRFSENALYANGEKLYTMKYPDMWYKVRIVGNPSAGKADIYLNGRVIGTVPLYTSNSIDSLEISSKSGAVSFDDLKVFALAEHEDYVPVPQTKANLDDYIVALNICSLWKNTGYSAGWGCISPYEENKPVLGYYDEGVPETADWEIKYMVEHGIDVQSFCWYNNASNGPVKTPWGGDHLHDGYMYAKYSDYMKYMIMWETNATGCNSSQFRNYIIPFWFENYFLDDRYLKIDNKIVLNCWSVGNLITDKYFGSYEGLKAEIDYLQSVAKEHGFEGVILLTSITDDSKIYECGFDGSMAYNWGQYGFLYDRNVSQNTERAKLAEKNGYYHIPTVSIGFNGVPWGYMRTPTITVEDYKKAHEWVKNTYIPTYAKESWQQKLVWLSTWNEYGEGTYIMPAELCGFGYLDAVRSTYTGNISEHTDVTPTASQLERITHLFPQYARRLVRVRGGVENTANLGTVVKTIAFGSVTNKPSYSNTTLKVSGGWVSGGTITGTSTTYDPIIYMPGISSSSSVDISNVDSVRVTARVPKGSTIQLFYATDEYPAKDASTAERQSVYTVALTDQTAVYEFPVSQNESWSGKLTSLRLDPTVFPNAQFYIEKVEFVNYDDVSLTVNDIEIKSGILPDIKNGKLLFPFDTDTCVQYHMSTYVTWRKDSGLFMLEANGHKVVYNVGFDKYTLDGTEKSLGYTMYLKDGVPMLDFEQLCADFGYECEKDGNKLSVTTPQKRMYEEFLSRTEAAWEFNGFDTEGFTSQNMAMSVSDGYLRIENDDEQNNNPHILTQNNLNIPSGEYNSLEIRVRYKCYGNPERLQIFYALASDEIFTEDKSFSIPITSADTNGEWITYKLNLSEEAKKKNREWNDTVTWLRVDPFNAYGYMDIDYIRFSYDYAYVDSNDVLGIGCGNAEEETTGFTVSGATLSTTEDPGPYDTDGNHVYTVTGKSDTKYVFFRHPTLLRKDITYKISFDIKLIGDSDGNADVSTKVVCNFDYPDLIYGRVDNGHHFGHTAIKPSDGWVHIEKTFTVQNIDAYLSHAVGIFCDPTSSGKSAVFMVDNMRIRDVNDPLGLGPANAETETEETTKFVATGAALSIAEDPGLNNTDENRVYLVTGSSDYNYVFFRHPVLFDQGATYKISFDIKLVSDCEGNKDVNTKVVCNFDYPDSVYGRTDNGHHFGHTAIKPTDGWVHIEKTYNVQNIDAYTGHKIGLFCDPTSSGKSAVFMVDNFAVTQVE